MGIIESIESKYKTWKAKRAVKSAIKLVSDLYDINIPKEVYPKIEVEGLKKYSFSDLSEIMIKRATGGKVKEEIEKDFDFYEDGIIVYAADPYGITVLKPCVYDPKSNTIHLREPYWEEAIVEEVTHFVRAYAIGYIGREVDPDEVSISELLAEVTIQKIFKESIPRSFLVVEYDYAIKAGELWKKGVDVFSELTSNVKPSDLIRMPAKEIEDNFISILNKYTEGK